MSGVQEPGFQIFVAAGPQTTLRNKAQPLLGYKFTFQLLWITLPGTLVPKYLSLCLLSVLWRICHEVELLDQMGAPWLVFGGTACYFPQLYHVTLPQCTGVVLFPQFTNTFLSRFHFENRGPRDLAGGSVAKTSHSQCRGSRLDPSSGN